MSSFGENLRREREMRGVNLQEISLATKISVRFLQAVEDEEFSKVPGGIFTRSFIRAYAKYLGLDEERVLAEYQLAAQPKEDVNLKSISLSRPAPPGEASRSPVFTVLVAAAMLAGVYVLHRHTRRAAEAQGTSSNPPGVSASPAPVDNRSQNKSATAATVSVGPTSPGPAPATGVTQNHQAPSGAETSSAGPPSPAAAGKKGSEGKGDLVLQVAATEAAWVAVDADGKTTLQRILNPHEVETLKAVDSFDVTTGNAQGIILTLNGETLKPLGRHGEVKKIHLTHDDLKNPGP